MGRLGVFFLFAGIGLAATCPVQDLGLNSSVDSTLADGDCAIRDVDSNYTGPMLVKQYRIILTDKGVVTLRLSSSAFNTYLYIYDSARVIQALNDDADGSTNSRITISLNPGTYFVVA